MIQHSIKSFNFLWCLGKARKLSLFQNPTCFIKGKVTQNGVNMTYTMRLNDNLETIRHIFSVYAKGNSEGELASPHIFNFMSFGNWFLFIKRDRRNKYLVCGRLPFKVIWVNDKSTADYLCYYDCKCFNHARSQFYVLAQRLLSGQYVERKDECPVLNRFLSN